MAALVGSSLPGEKIAAAVYAALLCGLLLAALPPLGFRIARLLTAITLPLCWLWVAYAGLNGMGPAAIIAARTLAETNPAEVLTQLQLLASAGTVCICAFQAVLLAASYAAGAPRASRHTPALLAVLLGLLMLNAWIPRLLPRAPGFLPGRDDWQNFPYGSLADVAVTALIDHDAMWSQARSSVRRPPAAEAAVSSRIDAIFIIGESFRYERQSDASPDRGAWAALKVRFGAGLGVLLPPVCASADATALSVPMLMTGTTPANQQDAVKAPSGLGRLAAAGYETAWISNQHQDFFPEEKRDLLWFANGYANQYDEALLPMAAAFLGKNDQRNKALVLHLMDSHAAYEDRYPSAAEPDGLDAGQQELLRYHRANAHTAAVLGKIAALLDNVQTPAFAVYVSDHGENLIADHNGMHYHFGARTTARAAYVPAVVLWNAAFGKAYDPTRRLQPLVSAAALAHADVHDIWLNFAGLKVSLLPTPEPRIYGKVSLTDPVAAVPCARLEP
jgi:glucan phosphoethanolaminetransferase (alkaline phosphatase superfamily)